jgi:hypothetical protein
MHGSPNTECGSAASVMLNVRPERCVRLADKDKHMKRLIALSLAGSILFLAGCRAVPHEPVKTMGVLQLLVSAPSGVDVMPSRIYVDDAFVSNVSHEYMPILNLKCGQHVLRVQLDGMKTYQHRVEVLPGPNYQFVDVRLQRE